MKGSRFSEEQILGILRGPEAGLKAAEVCRRHGIAESTLYNWKAKSPHGRLRRFFAKMSFREGLSSMASASSFFSRRFSSSRSMPPSNAKLQNARL
jgi:transposase-like protein